MSLTNVILDLAGNHFDHVPGTPGLEPYELNFVPSPTRTQSLGGMENGGGAVSYRGFIYALERGTTPGIRIYKTDDILKGTTTQAGFVPLIGQPRDLVLIHDWPHKRSLHDDTVRTADLLAVVGGDVGTSTVDANGDVTFPPQYLRVYDLSAPANPERVLGGLLTLTNSIVNRLAWSPPYLGYIDSGSDLQEVGLINLQSMMVGFNGTSEETSTFPLQKFDGVDLEPNGSFVQANERLPTPERLPQEFYGKEAAYLIDGPGVFQDVAMATGFVGAVTTGGTDATHLTPTHPSYRTLRANGQNLPAGLGVCEFEFGSRPKRLTILMNEPVEVNGQLQKRSLGLVTMAPDSSNTNRIVMVDLTNPAIPTLLSDSIDIPPALGIPQSIFRREDGLLALATTTNLILLDPKRLLDLVTGQSVQMHPAIVSIIPQAGSGNRTMDSDPSGVSVVSLGGRNQVLQSAPRLSFILFPKLAGTIANPSVVANDEAALDKLMADSKLITGIPWARLKNKGGAVSSITPASPLAHSHVLVDCPGGAGSELEIALEVLKSGGSALADKGKGFPPVKALDSKTLKAIAQDKSSTGSTDADGKEFRAPVIPLKAHRLSDSPSSRYYNLYLSDPFALICEKVTPAELTPLTKDRVILWSGDKGSRLRASIDNVMSTNDVVGTFADTIDSSGSEIIPNAFVTAETLPGGYLPGDNQSPPDSEIYFPGTFKMVNALNGQMCSSEVDFMLPSRRMPIVFKRTIASQDLYSGPFGPGWNFTYNQHLIEYKAETFAAGNKAPIVVRDTPDRSTIAEAKDVLLDDGEAHTILFKNKGTTAPDGVVGDLLAKDLGWFDKGGEFYVPDANTRNVYDLLYRYTSKEFCRITPDGSQFWYAEDGRLLRIKDRHLNTHELAYEKGNLTRISDTSVTPSRFLEFGYYQMAGKTERELDAETKSAFVAGHIRAIRDFTGRVTTYKYFDTGVLKQVSHPDTDSTATTSEGAQGFKGQPTTSYLMVSQGQDGFAGVIEGNGANSTSGTNSGSKLFAATLDNTSGKPVVTSGSGAGGGVAVAMDSVNSSEQGASPVGNKGTRDDASKTNVSYNGFGQPTGISKTGNNADPANTSITYTDDGRIETITGREGDTLKYEYFTSTLIRSKPNIHRITRTPGHRGGPAIKSSFNSYDLHYNLPEGNATDENGNSITCTLTEDKTEVANIDYGSSGSTKFTYNDFGQKLTESTPDGITHTWTPNTDTGYLDSSAIGNVTTTYTYNSSIAAKLGQPTGITLPRGAALTLTYDSRLLPLSQKRGADQESKMAYDENGNEVYVSTTVDSGVKREEFRAFNQVNFMTSSRVKAVESSVGTTADLATTYVPDEVFQVKEIHFPAPSNEVQTFTYDHLGRKVNLQTGDQVTNWGHDLLGNLTKIRLSNAGIGGLLQGSTIIENTFDGHNRPITIKRPGSTGNEVTTMTYFDGGQVKTRKTQCEVDGDQTDIEDMEVTGLDACGRPTDTIHRGSTFDATAHTDYTASDAGLTVVETGPKDTVTRKMDNAGRLKSEKDSLANRTYTVNDSFKVEDVASLEDGTTYTSSTRYDDLDRITSVLDDVGTISTITPRVDGLPKQASDGLNQVTNYNYSKLGEMIRKDRPQSLRMNFNFDGNRRLVAVTDRTSKGNLSAYEDQRLRLTKKTMRDGSTISMNSPNGFNLPEAVVLPGNGSAAMEYDGQGRTKKVETTFKSTTHLVSDTKYDAKGRVRSVTYKTQGNKNSAATFTYDKLGPLIKAVYDEEGGPYTVEHGIREDGARTSLKYPSGVTVTEDRDNSGRLVKVTVGSESTPVWNATTFKGATEPTEIRRGPLTESRTYDLRRRLLSSRVKRNSDQRVLSEWRYVWDAANNLSARQGLHEQGRADLLTYDTANRLTRAHLGARPTIGEESAVPILGLAAEQDLKPGYAARSYSYDTGGLDLLTGMSVVDDGSLTKPFPFAPFPTEISGHDNFLYPHTIVSGTSFDRGAPDELGDAVTIRHPMLDASVGFTDQTATLTHNGRHDLVKAHINNIGDFAFHYRPDHLLHRKTKNSPGGTTLADRELVWDGARLLEEYNVLTGVHGQLVARYYYAEGDTPVAADFADSGNTLHRYYFIHDNVMSVTALVDGASGEVVERMHYDPWGYSMVELRDQAPPRVERVIELTGGELLFVFTEPVLPLPTISSSGLATTAAKLSSLMSITNGSSAITGKFTYEESAGGLPFGTVVRFKASIPAGTTVNVTVNPSNLYDSWGNGNIAETFSFSTTGNIGQLYSGSLRDTSPTLQAASAVGNPFRFQGQYADMDLGLIYMRARFYDPLTATFLEPDPIEYKDSVNQYAAFGQSPAGVRDPMGTSKLLIKRGVALVKWSSHEIGNIVRDINLEKSIFDEATDVDLHVLTTELKTVSEVGGLLEEDLAKLSKDVRSRIGERQIDQIGGILGQLSKPEADVDHVLRQLNEVSPTKISILSQEESVVLELVNPHTSPIPGFARDNPGRAFFDKNGKKFIGIHDELIRDVCANKLLPVSTYNDVVLHVAPAGDKLREELAHELSNSMVQDMLRDMAQETQSEILPATDGDVGPLQDLLINLSGGYIRQFVGGGNDENADSAISPISWHYSDGMVWTSCLIGSCLTTHHHGLPHGRAIPSNFPGGAFGT